MFKSLALIGALILTASASEAATPQPDLLIKADWLADHIGDPNLIVLQLGPRNAYDAGHIPGAVYLDQFALSVTGPAPGNLILELPTAQQLQEGLQQIGVSDDTRIVVSYARGQLPAATRVVFTLDAVGLGDHVSLLDGGADAWRRAGHALSTDAPAARQGHLSALNIRPLVVDATYVSSHLGAADLTIIDGRDSVFFTGERAGGSAARPQPAGHIRSARSIPYSLLTNADGEIKSAAELTAIFAAAGARPGDRIVAYCHVGQQATAVIFAARLIGVEAVLYDGSFQDWSQRDLPVEGPGAS